jgi:transposase-like protein
VLGVVGVLADGGKQLLALELCAGASFEAWKGCLEDLAARGLYAAGGGAARTAVAAFERTWAKRCPGVVTSLREGGDELLTFFHFPKTQWKTLRTTNVIERLHEEFRRRVKTPGSLPTEDAALILLFSLVASGQIKLRRIDGWRKIAGVISQHTGVATR